MNEEYMRGVIGAIVDAYKNVEHAPDGSLDPVMAWTVGAAYVAEFTCRNLYKRGLIEREDAAAVFEATGGDKTDPKGWNR